MSIHGLRIGGFFIVTTALLSSCKGIVDGGGVIDGGVTMTVDAGPVDGGASAFDAGGPTTNPTLRSLPDDTALDLGLFTCTETFGDRVCQGVTGYSGLTYDSTHHQFLMFGGGHATTMTDSIFAFDLDSTLTWRELYEPTPCDLMTPDNLKNVLVVHFDRAAIVKPFVNGLTKGQEDQSGEPSPGA